MIAPFLSIKINHDAEARFRKRALRAVPREYMESLWGKSRNGVLYIHAFMPFEHKGIRGRIDYEDAEMEHQEESAKEENLEFLGTIHTHPNRDEVLFSEEDLRSSQGETDTVMAICAIEYPKKRGQRRKCRMAYWPTVKPINIEYSYWSNQ